MPNRIRAIRKQRKLTMQQLADKVGTSQQQVDRLEKGYRKLTIDWLDKITKALECDIYDVLPDSFSKRDIMMTSKAKVVGAIRSKGEVVWFDEDKEAYHIIFGRLPHVQEPKLFALVVETDELSTFPKGTELVFADLQSIKKHSSNAKNFVYIKLDMKTARDIYYFSQQGKWDGSDREKAVLVKVIKDEPL